MNIIHTNCYLNATLINPIHFSTDFSNIKHPPTPSQAKENVNLFQQHPEAFSSNFHIGEILVFSTPSCFCHTSYFEKGFILNTYTAISDTAQDSFQLHLYLDTRECVYSSIFTVTNEHCTTPHPPHLKWGESMEEKPHLLIHLHKAFWTLRGSTAILAAIFYTTKKSSGFKPLYRNVSLK